MKKSIPSIPFLKNINLLDISNLVFEENLEFAKKMDENDPLRMFQKEFNYPADKDGNKLIYFCGNSLGLQSKKANVEVHKTLDQWHHLGVKGHFNGERPWVDMHLSMKEKMAEIVGAKASEVTLMNTLSVNLHLMLTSFYRPKGDRTKILIETDIFPSDRYAVESQIEWHGLEIKENLIYIPKSDHDELIKEEVIAEILEKEGNKIALVLLGGVNYYTGQLLNIAKLTKLGHKYGCIVGFDLAHAAGNVPLNLHEDDVDFAVWCTYKYLNGGPGSIAGAYVHEKFHNDTNRPKLKGWWGHNAEIRFGMREEFDPAPGVESWQISCQPILSLAPIIATLEMMHKASFKALRNKSILLTGYLEYLLKKLNNQNIKIITPHIQAERGCQLSIKVKGGDKSIYTKLIDKGFVMDWRNPNVIRVAPTPLYNGYEEVWRFVQALQECLLT